ncbi:MAG TPA: hypothetical protein VFG20_04095 [Planctomycetaceae bacterium]|nr:hypothetical protein [Planctomycetaceae bacterium]
MIEGFPPPADKTAAELRAEFLAVYEKAEAIREKLDNIISELDAHGLVFSEADPTPADGSDL